MISFKLSKTDKNMFKNPIRTKEKTMIQIKCVSGEPGYMETELGTMLSAGWEIISIETNIYESYGTVRKDVTAFLKKVSE